MKGWRERGTGKSKGLDRVGDGWTRRGARAFQAGTQPEQAQGGQWEPCWEAAWLACGKGRREAGMMGMMACVGDLSEETDAAPALRDRAGSVCGGTAVARGSEHWLPT